MALRQAKDRSDPALGGIEVVESQPKAGNGGMMEVAQT